MKKHLTKIIFILILIIFAVRNFTATELSCTTDMDCLEKQEQFEKKFYDDCTDQIKCTYDGDCATKDFICMDLVDKLFDEEITMEQAQLIIKNRVSDINQKNHGYCWDTTYAELHSKIDTDSPNWNTVDFPLQRLVTLYCVGKVNNKQLYAQFEKLSQ